jgi:hypothetical protein
MYVNELNHVWNYLLENVLTWPVVYKADLVHCLIHLISSTIRRHHRRSCSFVLFSSWELVKVVKDDSDRYLQKWMGWQGDKITKVF